MSESEVAHNILTAQQLSIGYQGKKQAFLVKDKINLSIRKGSLVALVGANGVGKSTLIKTLTRELSPLDGTLHLNGKPANTMDREQWARAMSVVHTKVQLSMNLSVYELISLGRHPYTNWLGKLKTDDLSAIEHAIEVTEVDAFRDIKCHQLSDGQLQRALIARALAQDTPLIILDEPTTHLDLSHKSHVLSLLKQLTKEGKTILFSSHDIELALELCDQMVVMLDHKIEIGDPQQLIDAGVISEMFPKDRILFDKKNKRFTLNK